MQERLVSVLMQGYPMKHLVITLPEHHEYYPHLWLSECGTYRIIRCCDNIQYIFQRWREPKWRSLSYHVEDDSLVRRWARHVTHISPSTD